MQITCIAIYLLKKLSCSEKTSHKETFRSSCFDSEFHPVFKKELTQFCKNSSMNLKKSFYEVSIPLIPKPDKEIRGKINYRYIFHEYKCKKDSF